MFLPRIALLATLFGILGCAGPTETSREAAPGQALSVEGLYAEPVFAADTALFDAWTLVPIRGDGRWGLEPGPDGALAIAGRPEAGASAIYLNTDIDPVACPVLEWQWSVGAVQPSADLTRRETDDVAAALFVLFGDAGSPLDPKPVPTLRYVWTTERHQVGDVIPNPYLPDFVRNIVVARGEADIGVWRQERRDLQADYRAAFGAPPDAFVWSVALFVDNDQTGEPAAAFFRDASVYCD